MLRGKRISAHPIINAEITAQYDKSSSTCWTNRDDSSARASKRARVDQSVTTLTHTRLLVEARTERDVQQRSAIETMLHLDCIGYILSFLTLRDCILSVVHTSKTFKDALARAPSNGWMYTFTHEDNLNIIQNMSKRIANVTHSSTVHHIKQLCISTISEISSNSVNHAPIFSSFISAKTTPHHPMHFMEVLDIDTHIPCESIPDVFHILANACPTLHTLFWYSSSPQQFQHTTTTTTTTEQSNKNNCTHVHSTNSLSFHSVHTICFNVPSATSKQMVQLLHCVPALTAGTIKWGDTKIQTSDLQLMIDVLPVAARQNVHIPLLQPADAEQTQMIATHLVGTFQSWFQPDLISSSTLQTCIHWLTQSQLDSIEHFTLFNSHTHEYHQLDSIIHALRRCVNMTKLLLHAACSEDMT